MAGHLLQTPPVKTVSGILVALCLLGPFFAPALAINVPIAEAAPALAVDVPATQADCNKAGMRWQQKTSTCKPRGMGVAGKHLSALKKVLGLIGLGCVLIGLYQLWARNESAENGPYT
jgi:hypothetical protein